MFRRRSGEEVKDEEEKENREEKDGEEEGEEEGGFFADRKIVEREEKV